MSDKEAKIYNLLVVDGSMPIGVISKKTGLKRGITYKILYGMAERKIVSKEIVKGKIHFKPLHPYKLLELLKANVLTMEHNLGSLESAISEITSTYKLSQNQPGVRVFEGVEGIKEVYNDTLREGKEIWAVLQTSDVQPEIYKWLTTVYAKKRREGKILAKVIVAADRRTQDYVGKNEAELRETVVVAKDKFQVGIEMDIYGDKVAFITFRKDADHIAILIQNKLIADTMRAMWGLVWEHAMESSTLKS